MRIRVQGSRTMNHFLRSTSLFSLRRRREIVEEDEEEVEEGDRGVGGGEWR